MPKRIDHDRRRFLGAAAMAGAALPFGLIGCRKGESSRTEDGSATLAGETDLDSLASATAWINSGPLTAAALRGKVVLVQFCTYTCINWLRTLPWVRAWIAKYSQHGLALIGVHSPEFEFESDLAGVRRALDELRVHYPVAVDNDHVIWRAFDNNYWPALFLVDRRGRRRYHHFGEGRYDESERMIQRLLSDGGTEVKDDLVSVDGQGAEAAADWGSLKSPENYLGYERTRNFASPGGGAVEEPRPYAVPSRLRLNEWALAGNWTMRRQAVSANAPDGRIALRFHARDLHLVMGAGPQATPVRFRVLVDGQPPGDAHGHDIDAAGNGVATTRRLYQLLRQHTPIADRQFEIQFLDAGIEAYAFTFG